MAGALISAYIVLEAARFGLPRETLLRMVSNIVTETVVGSIPVVGDLLMLPGKQIAVMWHL